MKQKQKVEFHLYEQLETRDNSRYYEIYWTEDNIEIDYSHDIYDFKDECQEDVDKLNKAVIELQDKYTDMDKLTEAVFKKVWGKNE